MERAIAKLREYQLVDRSAWILEAIRAGQTIRAFRENDDGRWTIPYPAETEQQAPVAAPVAGGTDR